MFYNRNESMAGVVPAKTKKGDEMKKVIEGGDIGIDEIFVDMAETPLHLNRELTSSMQIAFAKAQEDEYIRSFGQSYYNWCRRGGKH